MSNPIVSVCIPTYRGSQFLAAAIDSVLNQTYQNFEIWILDDNSPDDTELIALSYSDPRVKYIRNSHNLGPEGNWNRCLGLRRVNITNFFHTMTFSPEIALRRRFQYWKQIKLEK